VLAKGQRRRIVSLQTAKLFRASRPVAPNSPDLNPATIILWEIDDRRRCGGCSSGEWRKHGKEAM